MFSEISWKKYVHVSASAVGHNELKNLSIFDIGSNPISGNPVEETNFERYLLTQK